jgi:hypothetical protein
LKRAIAALIPGVAAGASDALSGWAVEAMDGL